ncbi:hypothetical protein [Streptomyces sp. NPDC001820]|uniref:hypothetical protein n=1 Tax=Streptomyces sp. NPDC001820 TaxID=3364613 RepID=UPI003694B672
MTLFETSQVYASAQHCEIWDEAVTYEPVRNVVLAITRLLRSLEESADSDLWRERTQLMRRASRWMTTVPLPLSSVDLGLGEAGQQLTAWANRMREVLPEEMSEKLTSIGSALSWLGRDKSDPLGDCASEFVTLDEPGSRLVVLTDRRFSRAVTTAMARRGVSAHVGTYVDLQTSKVFSSAAVIGPPMWVPPSVLSAPRVRNLSLVHYQFFHQTTEVAPLFGEVFGAVTASTDVVREVQRSRPYEVGNAPGWQPPPRQDPEPAEELLSDAEYSPAAEILADLRHEQLRRTQAAVHEPLFRAQIASLADGSHVLLPLESIAWVLSVDPDAPPGRRVAHEVAASASPGQFLALRTRPHHQDLVDRADDLLGADAVRLRAVQSRWKRELRDRTLAHPRGIRGVADELRRLGAQTANVAYWTSIWCIKTRSRDDFGVVMRYLGRGAEAEQVWADLARIDSAHRRSGRSSVDRLEAALSPRNLDQLREAGWSKVRAEGAYGALVITRIDEFIPGIHQVPANALCTLLQPEEN